MCEKYQGWKNFETWGTSLIITNDENALHEYQAVAVDAFNDPVVYDESERLRNAANAIRELMLDEMQDFFETASDCLAKMILEQITDFTESTNIDFESIAESLLGDEINMKQYHKEMNR